MSALPQAHLQLVASGPALKLLDVRVRRPMPGRCPGTRTAEYTALYESSFDAYDDALNRFPDALRIEVLPTRRERPTTVPVVWPVPGGPEQPGQAQPEAAHEPR